MLTIYGIGWSLSQAQMPAGCHLHLQGLDNRCRCQAAVRLITILKASRLRACHLASRGRPGSCRQGTRSRCLLAIPTLTAYPRRLRISIPVRSRLGLCHRRRSVSSRAALRVYSSQSTPSQSARTRPISSQA